MFHDAHSSYVIGCYPKWLKRVTKQQQYISLIVTEVQMQKAVQQVPMKNWKTELGINFWHVKLSVYW
jgi:hypothetical protein